MLIAVKRVAHIPITQVADIRIRKGPPSIKSENTRRTAWIYIDIKGIDVGAYVANAQKIVSEKFRLPMGYNMSEAVWVGIIVLAGISAETGVVMLLYLDLAFGLWKGRGRMQNRGDLVQAIHHGAVKPCSKEKRIMKKRSLLILAASLFLLPLPFPAVAGDHGQMEGMHGGAMQK